MLISNTIKFAAVFAISSLGSFAYSATELPVDITGFDIGGVELGMNFEEALEAASKRADVSKESVKAHERIHPWFDRSLKGFTIQNETSILTPQLIKHVPPSDERENEFVTYIDFRFRGDSEELSMFKRTALEKYGEPSLNHDNKRYFWCGGSIAVTNDLKHCNKEQPALSMQDWGEGVVKLYLINYTPHNQLTEYEESLAAIDSESTSTETHSSTLSHHDAYVGVYGAEFKTQWPFNSIHSRHSHKKYEVPKTVFKIRKDGDAYILNYLLADPADFIVLRKIDNGFEFNDIAMSLSEDKNTLYVDINNIAAMRITEKEWKDLEPHAIKESCSQHVNIIAKEHGHTTYGQISGFYDEYHKNYKTQTCFDNDRYYIDDIDCELNASEAAFKGKKPAMVCQNR